MKIGTFLSKFVLHSKVRILHLNVKAARDKIFTLVRNLTLPSISSTNLEQILNILDPFVSMHICLITFSNDMELNLRYTSTFLLDLLLKR